MTTSALERVIRRGATGADQAERCDMCALVVPDRHRHALDTERSELMCLCRPCALLFDQAAASRGHYRLVPERRIRLSAVPTHVLGTPVGLAYFIRGADDVVTAHYPSPMGATRWEIDPSRWQVVLQACPTLEHLQPEVEALLVNTARGAEHRWLVPIDDCFRLVALVAREWKGMSGGSRVWPEIEKFFAELKEGTRG